MVDGLIISVVMQLLKDSTVQGVASKCKRSPAQVLLRWGIQNDMGEFPQLPKVSLDCSFFPSSSLGDHNGHDYFKT